MLWGCQVDSWAEFFILCAQLHCVWWGPRERTLPASQCVWCQGSLTDSSWRRFWAWEPLVSRASHGFLGQVMKSSWSLLWTGLRLESCYHMETFCLSMSPTVCELMVFINAEFWAGSFDFFFFSTPNTRHIILSRCPHLAFKAPGIFVTHMHAGIYS